MAGHLRRSDTRAVSRFHFHRSRIFVLFLACPSIFQRRCYRVSNDVLEYQIQHIGITKSGMFLFLHRFLPILLQESMYPLQFIGSMIVIAGVILFTAKPLHHPSSD